MTTVDPAPKAAPAPAPTVAPGLPPGRLPALTPPPLLLGRALVLVAVLFGLFLADELANVLLDYWMLDSLGYEDVFWTNFQAGTIIFVVAVVLFAAAIAVPAVTLGRLTGRSRRAVLLLAVLIGTYAGYTYLQRFPNYLLFFNDRDFGRDDPVFGHDIGFYVFDLPAIWTSLHILTVLALTAVASCVVFAWIGRERRETAHGVGRLLGFVGHVSRPLTLASIVFLGVVLALDTWFRRYSLLTKDNYDSSIPNGAQVVDVTGFFSNKNAILVEAVVLAFTTIMVTLRLRTARRAVTGAGAATWKPAFTRGALALLILPGLSIDLAFRGAVAVRNQIEVTPNEPVVQYPFIKRHIDATNTAYGLDKIEHKQFIPKGPSDPAPDLKALRASPTMRNAPLWPG